MQNTCLQSADFNTTWNQQNSLTVNSNTAISPDGTQNADTINIAAVSDSRITQVITVANSTTYTISCFYKNIALTAGETFNMRFNNFLTAPNNLLATATIDLAAGTATYTIGGTAGTGFSGTATGRIENYGNGWYRVSMTFTVGSAGGNAGGFQTAQVGSATARSFYAWGAQLEVGSVPTSYIPTAASPVTRGAETISKTGVSSLIGQTEGTIYAEVDVRNRLNGTAVLTLAKDANVSGRVIIYTNTNNQWRANYTDASGTIVDTSAANDTQVLGVNKLALAYGAGGNATLHCNGSLIITLSGTSTFVQELRAVFLGSGNGGSLFFNNRIRAAELYPTRLTNAQLQSLTQ